MNRSDLVLIRDINDNDKNFIYASWLRGLYYGDSWFSLIPKSIFMGAYHGFIQLVLDRKNTVVKIACLKDDPDVILGYAVLTPSVKAINWVFVKKAWRTIGIAKQLVPSEFKVATHLTKVGLSIASKKDIIFNPFV